MFKQTLLFALSFGFLLSVNAQLSDGGPVSGGGSGLIQDSTGMKKHLKASSTKVVVVNCPRNGNVCELKVVRDGSEEESLKKLRIRFNSEAARFKQSCARQNGKAHVDLLDVKVKNRKYKREYGARVFYITRYLASGTFLGQCQLQPIDIDPPTPIGPPIIIVPPKPIRPPIRTY